MKKFTFKNVLDGFRSSVTQPIPKTEQHALIEETLRAEFFQVAKTVRHGFPYQPTALAFDPIQKLLAVGTKHGSIRLIGQPGVDVHMQHEAETAVIQILFLPNTGTLVSTTVDDSIHLWSFKQKKPEVIHTLKFQRERITYIHLPFKSKFLYVGTERGNIYVVNIEVFQLSGYIINWNKAIELSRKTHPGSVVHLSDCPVDPNKLLIGYDSGQIVIWDLKLKVAEARYQSSEPLRSISWHHEGKQFMCSHTDGSLTTWMMKQITPKATSTIFPHAKTNKDGKQETCKTIHKVEWTCSKNGDSFVIFSGGLTNDRTGRTPSITVIHGKTTTVLEMEHTVIDFITLCETPWQYDFAEPYALIVLLNNDLVVVDLQSPGYPCFENQYAMDFHESPVTSCCYIADCPADVIPALYSIGARSQKRSDFSDKLWPISGGKWGSSCSYSELIVTGHADGSLKFWDASSVNVQILYKLKTAKIFEKPRTKSIDGDEDPFAVHHIALCPESRLLCVAGATSHVICLKYCKQENSAEVPCLEIPIVYDPYDSSELSPDAEFPTVQQQVANSHNKHGRKAAGHEPENKKGATSLDYFLPIHVKGGVQKKNPGYQAELVCLTPWVNGEPPGTISGISINSSYGLLAYGNESGLVIVDYVQKVCLLSMGTPELYGSADPYQRAPRSPKKPDSNKDKDEERCKSPSSDQKEAETMVDKDLFAVVGHIEKKAVKKSDEGHRGALKRLSSRISNDSGNNADGDCEKFEILYKKDGAMKIKSESKIGGTQYEWNAEEYDEIGNDVLCLDVNFTENALAKDDTLCVVEDTVKKESDPSVQKPSLQDMKSKSECFEYNKRNRFRFKDHLTKLDAKMRRAFSWENSDMTPGAEFYIKTQDDDCPIAEGVTTDATCSIDLKNSLPLPFPKDNKSPALTPSPSGRSLLKCSPRSPRLTPSPRPSPLEERPLEETDEEMSFPSRTKFSLELFDKEGNPIPPLRLRAASSLSSEQKTTEEDFSQETSKLSFSSASSHSTNPFGTPGDEVAHTNHSSPANRGTFRTFISQLSRMGSSHTLGDKLDSSTFSRSRSSSISSLDNITSEAIQCLAFADSYTKKNENQLCPTLWVGTSLGSVIQVLIFLPAAEERSTTPVNVTPSGTIFRLKGTILAMSFLDCNGALIPYTFESWKDAHRERKLERTPTRSFVNSRLSPTNSGGEQTWGDRQFIVIASDKVARVVALPSHNCVYKQIITDVSFVVKAEIIQMKDAVCLVCYIGTGHLSIFSLPSLRQLTYIEFVPLTDLRIARTFCFTNYGHGMFLCSPSEIQKFTLSAEFCKEMQDLLGNLFTQCETPEPPKQGFFKGIFGGGVSQVDRDELFGESSGKAVRSVAKHIPGPNTAIEGLTTRSTGVAAEVAKTRMMLVERGEKLGQLDDQTAKLMINAENYSNTAQGIMLKMKDKKWYQL